MLGTLSLVATPIGNLDDITLRALETLKNADMILCEDTRVSGQMLKHFQISKPLQSYHHHSDDRKMKEIVEFLINGKNLALITDAGTPGISDPGNLLVEYVVRKLPEVTIIPIPGASAVIAALSVSGFATDKFLFLGFPPHKNKRLKFFETVAQSTYTVVFYESNHRIKKCLLDLERALDPNQEIMIGRELTKKFETIYRGNIQAIKATMKEEKGEFVVVIQSH